MPTCVALARPPGRLTKLPSPRSFRRRFQEKISRRSQARAKFANTNSTDRSTHQRIRVDVSWVTPLATLGTATWVPGTSAHTWQATAAGGTAVHEPGSNCGGQG